MNFQSSINQSSIEFIIQLSISYQPIITCSGSPGRCSARSLRRHSSINYHSIIIRLSFDCHRSSISYQPIITCGRSPGRWPANSLRRFTCRALLPPLLRLLRRQPHPLQHRRLHRAIQPDLDERRDRPVQATCKPRENRKQTRTPSSSSS